MAGFKVDTGNFAGTTVSFTETKVLIGGRTVRLIDLPGTYSISSHDIAEKVARDYLLSGTVDVIINVLDTSLLARSLELTIQLMEMNIPMVIALNMFDEAQKKGIDIDLEKLKTLTGVEAVPVIAVDGTGVREIFEAAVRIARGEPKQVKPLYDRDVEECISTIAALYPSSLNDGLKMDERFVIIRLLEMDEEFERMVGKMDKGFLAVCHQAAAAAGRHAQLARGGGVRVAPPRHRVRPVRTDRNRKAQGRHGSQGKDRSFHHQPGRRLCSDPKPAVHHVLCIVSVWETSSRA